MARLDLADLTVLRSANLSVNLGYILTILPVNLCLFHNTLRFAKLNTVSFAKSKRATSRIMVNESKQGPE